MEPWSTGISKQMLAIGQLRCGQTNNCLTGQTGLVLHCRRWKN